MATLSTYLIVCPLVFVAGLVDAIAGGGGLISLPAYLMSGLPVHMALGTNKMSSCMGTALATLRYARRGFVRPGRAAICAAAGLAGSVAGARVALALDDGAFKAVMLVVVPATAAYVMLHRRLDAEKEPLPAGRTLLLCAAISVSLGAYDGFYGPGTGTFLTLAYMGLAHLGLSEAAGTCKAVNLTTNAAALAVFLMHGTVLLPLGLTAGLFNMAGAWVGTSCFIGKGAGAVRPVMLAVLAVFFVRLLADVLGGA